MSHRWYRRWGKRALDLVLVGATAPLWLAALGAVSVVSLLLQGPPLLFRQLRPGYRGELFTILKIRTMTDARGEDGQLLPDEQRLTPFGRWLRRTSLDELPELFNVLRGEMSLVGPRPLLPEYLPYFDQEQRLRHEVLPGITGWSQVNGRNALSWDDKLALDVWYVRNLSLWLDLKIILLTIWKVLKGEGIQHPGYATMPRFRKEDAG